MIQQIVLVDSEDSRNLYPFSLTHCSWELRAGYFTNLERWHELFPDCSIEVVGRTQVELAWRSVDSNVTSFRSDVPTLILDGSLIVPGNLLDDIDLTDTTQLGITENQLPAWLWIPKGARTALECATMFRSLKSLDIGHDVKDTRGSVCRRLHSVVDLIESVVSTDYQLLERRWKDSRQRVPDHVSVIGDHGILIHESASIAPYVVFDVKQGPIIIGPEATIGPFANVTGPTSIGQSSHVSSQTSIGPATTIGPVCKVGGEVSHTVMHGFSNKAHYGFIGHSYIGEWVNLGAGTTNSNLKTTYDDVTVRYPWGSEESNRKFVGVFIGDHTKTAIGTLLTCGLSVGVCSLVLASHIVTRPVNNFAFGVNGGLLSWNRALAVISSAMARRNKMLTNEQTKLLQIIAELGDNE